MDDRSPAELDDLPEDLLHLVKPELQPGERLLWASRAGVGSARNPGLAWPPKAAVVWFLGFLATSIGSFVAVALLAGRRTDGPEGGWSSLAS